MKKIIIINILFCLFIPAVLIADEECANFVHVRSSASGRFYAKSIPTKSTNRSAGITLVYSVRSNSDRQIASYQWYSQEIYLKYTIVIRMSPWPRGHKANKKDLAIGIYRDGKTIKEYSTLDIAGNPDNVSSTKSHYRVFKKKGEFRWGRSSKKGDIWWFDIAAIDGRILSFNCKTGEMKVTYK